jgi:hypothetical protein
MLSWRSPLSTLDDIFPASVIERNRQIDAEDRNCRNCLARLRDQTSVYCSTECRDWMADPDGAVDLPPAFGLVISLSNLMAYRMARNAHAAAA